MDDFGSEFELSTHEEEDDDDLSLGLSSGHGEEEEDGHKENAAEKKSGEDLNIAKRENTAVGCLRYVVLLALVLAAGAISFLVYYYTRQDEIDEFEQATASHATKLIEAFHSALESKLGAINSLSVAMTAYARNQVAMGQQGFPFITMPDWEVLSAETRVQADAVVILYTPLVRGPDHAAWEEYAEKNYMNIIPPFGAEMQQKALEDMRYNGTGGLTVEELYSLAADATPASSSASANLYPDGFNPRIHFFDGTIIPYNSSEESWLLPLWSTSPAAPLIPMLNYNIRENPIAEGAIAAMMATEKAVVDFASDLGLDFDPTGFLKTLFNMMLGLGQYRYDAAEFVEDPTSTVVYPVFDAFTPDRRMAAVLSTNIYWRLFFDNALPEDATGVIVVLENSFGQEFTYRVDGQVATYLGVGDKHETTYNHLEETAHMAQYITQREGPTTRSYTTVGLDDSYCDYTLRVYPSSDMEDEYLTWKPVWYMLIVASVFLVTSAIFLLYDYMVKRRQTLVMDNALKSGALISSLFPANVRDRLLAEAEEEKKREKKKNSTKRKEWMTQPPPSRAEKSRAYRKGPVIADQYDESTVLFADLSGFTKWSDKRSPQDVFELLETLYHAFDKIADRRGVYKIETVGDCYVAITGVPDPCKDHAPRMVKFARAIMLKMRALRLQLTDKLGKETSSLELRIGLHSGPVTAGVLRGKKSRFQLFGDTVNTASRMESNGLPGRVHVSQTVADNLKEHGYGRWLEARQDKVVAKGKGEMQTYWIVGGATLSTGTGSSLGTSSEKFNVEDFSEFTNRQDTTTGETTWNAEDDDFMLDLQEKLQQRAQQRTSIKNHGDLSSDQGGPTDLQQSTAESEQGVEQHFL